MANLGINKYGQAGDNKLFARIKSKDIAFLTKIMEAYENLALVTTLDAAEGLLVIHVTPDTKEAVKEILENLPIEVNMLEPNKF